KGFDVRGPGSASGGGGGGKWKVYGLYAAPVATPYTFNKLAYQKHENEAPNTLWEVGEPTTSTFFSGGGAIGIPLWGMSLIPGFRYQFFKTALVFSDLFEGDRNRFVEVKQSASAM